MQLVHFVGGGGGGGCDRDPEVINPPNVSQMSNLSRKPTPLDELAFSTRY